MNIRALFCSVSLALASSAAAQTEARSLRIHWEPGRVYHQETTTDTTTSASEATEAGQSMHVVQSTLMQVATGEKNNHRHVGVTFATVRGEIRAGGKTLTYDSSSPEIQNPALRQILGQAVGKKFTLVYDEQDRFVDTRDMSSLSSEPGTLSSLSAMADATSVAQLFRKSLEMGLPPLPVQVGDTWTLDETIPFPRAGEVRVAMNGKFAAVETFEGRPHAKIVFEGKFGNTAPRPGRPTALTEITGDSSMTGVFFFDLEQRIVTSASYTTKLKLQSPGLVIPLEQKVTSRMEVGESK